MGKGPSPSGTSGKAPYLAQSCLFGCFQGCLVYVKTSEDWGRLFWWKRSGVGIPEDYPHPSGTR